MRERLQKLLSAAGVASRRAAERLIVEGRVTVNGQPVTELGAKADPDRDDVRVDGRRIRASRRRLYILLHKPRGYVTTRHDPEGRPTVLDLLQTREYVYPVGRLDYDSEGLLLLTNDGDLAAKLTHPRHEVEREYEARVRGVPAPDALRRMAGGLVVEGRRTAPARVRLVRSAKDQSHAVLRVVIREGRKRQVRQMCESIGHPVVRLTRVRLGSIELGALRPGESRALRPEEVRALRAAAERAERTPGAPKHRMSGAPKK